MEWIFCSVSHLKLIAGRTDNGGRRQRASRMSRFSFAFRRLRPCAIKIFLFLSWRPAERTESFNIRKKNEYLIHLLLPFFQLPHDEIGLLLKLLPNLSLFFFLCYIKWNNFLSQGKNYCDSDCGADQREWFVDSLSVLLLLNFCHLPYSSYYYVRTYESNPNLIRREVIRIFSFSSDGPWPAGFSSFLFPYFSHHRSCVRALVFVVTRDMVILRNIFQFFSSSAN